MSNNNSTTETGEKKFCISELIQEHETFEHIMDAKFLTSTKLCELISAMFSNIYADYEGCNMEFLPGSNTPSITLFFNHKNTDSALPFAFSKEDTDNKTTNSTLRSTRSFNNRLINGDKYYPTDKGYALEEFLFDNNNLYVTNKDGKRIPNWGKLIAEVADGNFQFMNVPQQYTQVKCLDPGKIVEAIFGRFDGNSEWVYGIAKLLKEYQRMKLILLQSSLVLILMPDSTLSDNLIIRNNYNALGKIPAHYFF